MLLLLCGLNARVSEHGNSWRLCEEANLALNCYHFRYPVRISTWVGIQIPLDMGVNM